LRRDQHDPGVPPAIAAELRKADRTQFCSRSTALTAITVLGLYGVHQSSGRRWKGCGKNPPRNLALEILFGVQAINVAVCDRYKICLLGRLTFLEMLMRGLFSKTYKAVSEWPKIMMVLLGTMTSPFGCSCPDLGTPRRCEEHV
jgi:hypothetical protein